MSDCKKKQREIHNGLSKDRCLHKEAETYLQIVQDDQCAGCPLRMPLEPIMANTPQLIHLNSHKGFPDCQFREYKDGLICNVTGLPVTPDICNQCEAETKDATAGLKDKLTNYYGAVRKWIAAGRPKRTPQEIKRLMNEHCKSCEMFVDGACDSCGCTVSLSEEPLLNKLAMGTEHCPLGRF